MSPFSFRLLVCVSVLCFSSLSLAQTNCTVNPCQNGGTCDEGTGSCTCPVGFSGDDCGGNPCIPNPCMNGGACEPTTNAYQCECAADFIGFTCDIPNPCTNNPCSNNGTCVVPAGSTNASCICAEGYSGVYCDNVVDPGIRPTSTSAPMSSTPGAPLQTTVVDSPCSSPCQNGGTCAVHTDLGPSCNCPYGWGGSACEIEMDIVVPRFSGRGHLTYPPLATGDTVFRVRFRTSQSSGLLLFNGQSDLGFGDYMQLSIAEGCLDLRFDLGRGASSVQLGHRVDDGEWHEVSVTRIGTMAILLLDNDETLMVTSAVSGGFTLLNVERPLYIGGIPSSVMLPQSANDVSGFVGCVYGFEEESRDPPASLPTGGVNVGECESSLCQLAQCMNGGSCAEDVNDPKGYSCNCTQGFTGEFCAVAICVSDPCLYGGTCVPTAESYTCVCAYGYTGQNCATMVNITTPAFSGNSYLVYSITPDTISEDTEVNIRVRTASSNSTGILMFASQRLDGRGDFFLVGVDNDVVFCQVELGSGSVRIDSPHMLVPGEWSTIAITRARSLVTLTVDDGSLVPGTTPGSFIGLQVSSNLFVGGIPEIQRKPSAVLIWSGYNGCIADVSLSDSSQISALVGIDGGRNIGECEVDACFYYTCYNGGTCQAGVNNTAMCLCPERYSPPNCIDEIDLCVAANPCTSGSTCVRDQSGNPVCLCPYGKDGLTCNDTINIAIPSFNKTDYAHMQLPPLPTSVGPTTTILFSILPATRDGLILYSALYYMPTTLDFVALLMKDGYLEFRYNLGDGTTVIRSREPLPLEEWHEVRAYRSGRSGYLSVNGVQQGTATSIGSTQSLNLNTPLYMGGAPDYRTLSPSSGVTRGFGGCLDDIVINNVRQTVAMATVTQDLQHCGEDPCTTLRCLNGGVCVEGSVLGRFECRCPGNYTGERCEQNTPDPCLGVECRNGGRCVVDLGEGRCGCPVPYGGNACQDTLNFTAARFSGFSYIELFRYAFSGSVVNRDEFSLDFKTSNSSGLLLWMGGQTFGGTDYMALGVNRGRVELRFDLGNGAVLLRSSQMVSDGNWHTVSVVRDGGTATLSLNGRESNVTSSFVTLDSSSNIWIGGHLDISTTTFQNSFVGCVRNVQVNTITVDLDSATNMVGSLDITSCD